MGQGERVELMGRAVLVGLHLVGLLLVDLGERVELMGRAVLVGLHLVGLLLVDLGERVELMDRAVLVGPVVLLLVYPVDREALMARVGLGDLASRVVLVAMGPVGLADPVDRVDLVRMGPADRVGLTSPAAPVDRVDLADQVDLDLTGQAARVDRLRRRTSPMVSTTAPAPRWAAPGTCPTDSARRITGRRLRPVSTDSAGTVGLPPVLRRLSGTDHRLPVAGAGLRLPVVGTAHGTGRRAMS